MYFRGKLEDSDEIIIPEYWRGLVDIDSITVNITPFKRHQNIAVKDITEKRILLMSDFSAPIYCFYHIFAERKDVNKLVVEK